MTSTPAWGIGRKLFALVLANALALSLLAGIVWFAFGRIESLTTAIANKEMARVFKNAALGRDLLKTLSELDRTIRDYQMRDTPPRDRVQVGEQLAKLARATTDRDLAEAIDGLAATAHRLLNQCLLIGETLIDLDSSDRHLLEELAALEQLTSRALIEETLAGKSTDYLDQVMALVTGYRESVMLIDKEIAQEVSNPFAPTPPAGKSIAMIDDLRLRLQTMTAATPEMAKLAHHLRSDLALYHKQIIALHNARGGFETILQEHLQNRDEVLGHMRRYDLEAGKRAEIFQADLQGVIEQTGRQIFWIGGVVALLSLILAIWFVRHSIQRPMAAILQQIAAIRNGTTTPALAECRKDEWGNIQSALSEMTADLSKVRGLLQQVIDTAPIRVFWKDRESRYLGCNPAFVRDAGKQAPADLIGQDDFAMGWAEQAELYRADDKYVMESGQSRLNYEEPQTTPDGRAIWLRTSKVPLRDEAGNVIGLLGIYDDITDRKRVKETLLDSEERFRSIFDNSLDGILFTSPEGPIFAANQAACDMLGWSKQELSEGGRNLIVDTTDPRLQAALEERSRTGRFQGELAYKRKDGTTFPVEVSSTLFTLQNGEKRAGILFRDITDRKRAEDERQHIVKAESLNRMAGAVAHNFNNMLGAVMGYLDLALDDIPENFKPRKFITQAMEASGQAATISKMMLTCLGQSFGNVESIDVSNAIREAYPLFNAALPSNVHLKAELAPSGPIIKGNATHLTQILSSLITNSVEALEEHEGEIVLKIADISPVEIIKSKLFPPGWKPMAAEYFSLSVADTGCGIDPENLDKIFDPFFTTKFAGRGLGLSIVPGLLKGFEGAISVESPSGQGATFNLFFPVIEREITNSREQDILAESVPAEKKELLVLVVDDESLVRDMAEEMLKQKLGYQVITACDGFKAIEIFKERKEEIGLVLLDLSMPGMNGWDTLAALRTYRSDIPAILISGFDESHVMTGTHPERSQAFLQKPFQSKELLKAIKTALQSPLGSME